VDWDALGAIGELVGALAVVATLGYLAIQLRFAAKMAQLGIAEQRRTLTQAVHDRLVENPDFAEIWLRGRTDYLSLNEIEKERFDVHVHDLIANVQTSYIQAELLGEAGNLNFVRHIMTSRLNEWPFLPDWWDKNQRRFAPKFCEFVNNLELD